MVWHFHQHISEVSLPTNAETLRAPHKDMRTQFHVASSYFTHQGIGAASGNTDYPLRCCKRHRATKPSPLRGRSAHAAPGGIRAVTA